MTKKDFEFFASFVVKHNLRKTATDELVEVFKQRNNRFDEERFLLTVGKLRNEKEKWMNN